MWQIDYHIKVMESQIKEDLKTAMFSRDEVAINTLRMLISEICNSAIAKGGAGTPMSDSDIIIVVQKELKKRREAAAGFRQGGREAAAQKEEAEAKVLEKYLPTQLSDEELESQVDEVISQTGASSIQDMGKVIGIVLGKVGQAADGSRVSAVVKSRLGKDV